MNFVTISSLILLVTVGTIWGILGRLTRPSEISSSVSNPSLNASNTIQDSVVLDDLPPPDDTYTPDQRRYS